MTDQPHDPAPSSIPEPSRVGGADRGFFGLTEADIADLDNWFTYHAPTPEQIPAFQAIRDAGHQFAETIMSLVPPSADRSVAVRCVRDAVMNANAGLACYPEGQPRP